MPAAAAAATPPAQVPAGEQSVAPPVVALYLAACPDRQAARSFDTCAVSDHIVLHRLQASPQTQSVSCLLPAYPSLSATPLLASPPYYTTAYRVSARFTAPFFSFPPYLPACPPSFLPHTPLLLLLLLILLLPLHTHHSCSRYPSAVHRSPFAVHRTSLLATTAIAAALFLQFRHTRQQDNRLTSPITT